MTTILDASAIVAFFNGEPGADIVECSLLSEECYIHAMNMCEAYKDCLDRSDAALANQQVLELNEIGVVTRKDFDEAFWKQVAGFKHAHRIAWGDAFLIALIRRLGGKILTADHKDFDPIHAQGICAVEFIR